MMAMLPIWTRFSFGSSTMVSVAPEYCPSCKGGLLCDRGRLLDAVEFAGRRVDGVLRGGRLWECLECGLQFRFPALSKAELDTLYRAASADAWAESGSKRVDWELARSILGRMEAVGSALDVGCWDGRFLLSLGGDWKLHGVEMSPLASQRAAISGVEILGTDIANLDALNQKFDLVTAFDVIEHMPDPKHFVQSCSRILRPGGLLMVATGNTQSLPWKMLGARHLYCIWPEHLSFISPDWCQRNAAIAGLDIALTLPYRRLEAGHFSVAADIIKNAVYKASPNLIAWLRRAGFGQVDHPVKHDYPLQWTTAKDHFLAVFRKA